MGSRSASALNIFSPGVLYGAYWARSATCRCCIFEVCYYQALEFCIERGIRVFEGGAQGEHKLARGFIAERHVVCALAATSGVPNGGEKFLTRIEGIELYVDGARPRTQPVPDKN